MNEPLTVCSREERLHSAGMIASVGFAAGVSLFGLVHLEWLPLLAAVILVAAGGAAMLRWPDLTTLVVIGLVYSNLAVVAVQFHGAPEALPAAVLAMLGWPLFYRLAIRKEQLCLYSALPFLVAFTVVQLIGVMSARYPGVALEDFTSFVLEGAVLHVLITNLVRTRRMIRASFWVLAICALLMGGAPLTQQLTRTFDTNYGGLSQAGSEFGTSETAIEGKVHQQRAAGTIGEQNRYAQFMLLLVPIGLALVAIEKPTRLRLLAILATLLSLLGFAVAYSRGAALGLIMAIGVAICLRLIGRNQLKLIFVGSVITLLLLPQYLSRLSSLNVLVTVAAHGDSGLDQADGAVRGRLTEMEAAALVFRDHPLVGVGPGMFTKYSQEYGQLIGLRSLADGREAHSLPLDIAAEHGLLGLLSFTALIIVVLRTLWQARKISQSRKDETGVHLSTGMLMVLILYLTTGLFLHFSYIRYFWLLVALADAVGHVIRNGETGLDLLPAQPMRPCPR